MDYIGHSDIRTFMQRVKDNGTLAHAYCFAGLSGLGKRTYAAHIAAELLGILPEKVTSHPDVAIIQQEVNSKTGKTKKHIDITQIRGLTETLTRHAAMGGYKVAIIDGAELLNAPASNALLKTLEEPRGKTIIFLLTTDERALLPTIRSRTQILRFRLVADTLIHEALIAHGHEAAHADNVVAASYGRPGWAVTLAEDAEAYERYNKEVQRFHDMTGQPFFKKLSYIEDLFGDKTDHIAARNRLMQALTIWQLTARAQAKEAVFSPKIYTTIQDTIVRAKDGLKRNVHPRLLVEHVLLALP